MILIFTNKADVHPTNVINYLISWNVPVFRLNTECLLSDYEFQWWCNEQDCDFYIKNIKNGLVLYGHEITAVWDRRPEFPSKLPIKYKKIVGWDCDYLIVDGENYREKNYIIDTDETICGFYKDQLQDLIDNNPKAKEIYLRDPGGWYWRCSCKGIGKSRKLHDLTNRTDKYMVKILTQYENKCNQL